jgi:hypothetical protein
MRDYWTGHTSIHTIFAYKWSELERVIQGFSKVIQRSIASVLQFFNMLHLNTLMHTSFRLKSVNSSMLPPYFNVSTLQCFHALSCFSFKLVCYYASTVDVQCCSIYKAATFFKKFPEMNS